MEQVYIRNVFAMSVPLRLEKKLKPETWHLNDSLGFTLHDTKTNQRHNYNLELYVNENGESRRITNWGSWGGNPVSFKRDESNQIEGLNLQLRVNHGVFDFRTLDGPQEARFALDYFSDNIFSQRAVSAIFQILPKPRTSSSRQRKR